MVRGRSDALCRTPVPRRIGRRPGGSNVAARELRPEALLRLRDELNDDADAGA